MTSAPPSGLPILGQLSPLSRVFLIGTLVLSLVAIVLDFGLHADESLLFVISAAAILGLAWVVGLSTERLGSLTGPQVGGILNATFGNIAELIIAFFALQAGYTWSHTLTSGEDFYGLSEPGDPRNIRAEFGPAYNDIRHAANFSANFDTAG